MKSVALVALAAGSLFSATASADPVPVATWNFNNTLAADQPGVAALSAINPLGLNSFMTDTVFGVSRTVYRFDGNQTPSEQAGLSINTTGLLNGDNAYSVDMIFQFEANQASWENILGVSNRQSDNAFYVEPGNHLQVYPTGGGPSLFTFGQYHRISLTNNGAGHVTAYMDGVFQFDLNSSSMDFSSYSSANPGRLIHFFADNVVGGGQYEYADGRVAMIRLYDGELTGQQVETLPVAAPVPEPETYATLLAGLGLLGAMARRRRQLAAA
jgi:hypothetical protein